MAQEPYTNIRPKYYQWVYHTLIICSGVTHKNGLEYIALKIEIEILRVSLDVSMEIFITGNSCSTRSSLLATHKQLDMFSACTLT